MAARPPQRSGWNDEHRDPDYVVSHGCSCLGRAENAPLSRLLVVHARHHHVRRHLSFRKALLRMAQKFEHYGVFLKPSALEKYEQYLGNNRRTEKGMEPRIEISGHLHNPEAIKDPSIKEYEIGLDPVFVDPNNPTNDRPHFLYVPPTDHVATIEKEDVARVDSFGPWHSAYFASYFTITGLHGAHVLAGVLVFIYMWLPVSKKLYQRNPEHLANRVEVSGLFWHFVDLVDRKSTRLNSSHLGI